MLTRTLAYYKDMFSDLASSRAYSAEGFAMPIPISEVKAYCELFGISGLDERERLYRMIRAMDTTFREVVADQVKRRLSSK